MISITLEVPDCLGEYENDAAEMAGLTTRTFAEILSDYGVSYINYSVEDLKDELRRNSGL